MNTRTKVRVLRTAAGPALGLVLAFGAGQALAAGAGHASTDHVSGAAAASDIPASLGDAATSMFNAFNANLPNLAEQAAKNPTDIYRLFQVGMMNPKRFTRKSTEAQAPDASDAFTSAFPTPQEFANWLGVLKNNPTSAITQIGDNQQLMADMANAAKMMGDRLPARMKNNLAEAGQVMSGIAGYDSSGTKLINMPTGNNAPPWSKGILGTVLHLSPDPVEPSPGGTGYGPSLLPHIQLGPDQSGKGGLGMTLDYTPIVNTNALTRGIRDNVIAKLPNVKPALPNSILGILTFRTYYATDRTGKVQSTKPIPGSQNLTGVALDIGLPGGKRLFTLNMTCPNMAPHMPGGAPQNNYAGYVNLDPKDRTLNVSFSFGDGVVDNVFDYLHYLPWNLFHKGNPGPLIMHP